MADIRIKDLATTASTTASDDFLAVDGTTNGTRKLSAATPSFATSVTVPGVVGPTSTDLTLTGGSTGASLVLGQGTNGGSVTTLKGTGTFDISRTTTPELRLLGDASAGVSYVSFIADSSITKAQISAGKTGGTGGYLALSSLIGGVLTEGARLSATGNLLIGTTTDMTGSGGLKIAGTTAATTTTSGALIVAGGVGVSGAGYFGGNIAIGDTSPTAFVGGYGQMHLTGTAGSLIVFGRTTATARQWRMGVGILGSDEWSLRDLTQNTQALTIAGTTGVVNIPATTSASSSTVGALTIGNGTAAINVAIGAGKVNIGSTEASVGSTSGALQVAGGIYAGAASVFGSTVTLPATGDLRYGTTLGSGFVTIGDAGTFTLRNASADAYLTANNSSFNVLRAATFAGAVSIGNTVGIAAAVASTHKVTMVIGGVTYYLLATNV